LKIDPAVEMMIVRLLDRSGPLTGFDLWKNTGINRGELWRTCMVSELIQVSRIGVDYLRLDRRIEGYARLSPSVLRSFLTYSVVGRHGDRRIPGKIHQVQEHIQEVSRMKRRVALNVVSAILESLDEERSVSGRLCVIIAGDVVYAMAHDMPRREKSTQKIVNGSDMDLVFVTTNDVDEHFLERLDDAIYREKLRLLMAPHMREEIDYVVKTISTVEDQIAFNTFPSMVACKILWEGNLLYGSEALFRRIKNTLKNRGVAGRLHSMKLKAEQFRKTAETILMETGALEDPGSGRFLFYPAEEFEEFE
jgi:hypothetical protein